MKMKIKVKFEVRRITVLPEMASTSLGFMSASD